MKYQCEQSGCNLLLNREGTVFCCSWGCGKRIDRATGKRLATATAKCIHCGVLLNDEEFQRGDFCEPCDKKLADQMGDETDDEYEEWLLENENDPTMEGWTP